MCVQSSVRLFYFIYYGLIVMGSTVATYESFMITDGCIEFSRFGRLVLLVVFIFGLLSGF